jgi:dephospho-CoA kinase
MRIIGLTGSIGMGKSVLAMQWHSLGVPVHDSDKIVHQLMQPDGEAFPFVKAIFPEVIINGKIDRKALGNIVFSDNQKRKKLESIIHPMVKASSQRFISVCRKHRKKICILDIPLLFEVGREREVDEIICASAPLWVQKRRVLSRPNMTPEKFKSIAKKQLPDYLKRLRSDVVVLTAKGRRNTLNALKRIKNNDV